MKQPDCKHTATRTLYDFDFCTKCTWICTHPNSYWGVAGGRWFKSTNSATFYKENGRLRTTLEEQKHGATR